MTSRELLDIAAEYVEARQNLALAGGHHGTPADSLDEIAGRWDQALDAHLAQRV